MQLTKRDEARQQVEQMMASTSWPATLCMLLGVIDRDGIGGVTTDQVVDYFLEKGTA